MKIFHVVENLDKGAVENMLINVFLESRKLRPEWKWTFFCILGQPGQLDEKVKAAGGEIIYSPVTISDKLAFLKNLRRVLKTGKYDILHVNHDYLSGFYLLASAGLKFKKRLLQIHNTDKSLPVGNRVLHKMLLAPFRKLALHYSDVVIGISRHVLEEFAGVSKLDSRHTVQYYGVDLERFNREPERSAFRQSLGLPVTAKICLYAGRMNDLKNPVFAVEIFSHLLNVRKDVYLVLIGMGDRQMKVNEKIAEYGLADHVKVLGWHGDVPLVMKNSDIFIFPRLEEPKEGLGIVVVEAQAAGLPMFITRGILPDAVIIPELAHFNKPEDPEGWAQQISNTLDQPRPLSQEESLKRMKSSPFELSAAAKNLVDLYEC